MVTVSLLSRIVLVVACLGSVLLMIRARRSRGWMAASDVLIAAFLPVGVVATAGLWEVRALFVAFAHGGSGGISQVLMTAGGAARALEVGAQASAGCLATAILVAFIRRPQRRAIA